MVNQNLIWERTLTTHKIQIQFIVVTPNFKRLFLRWAIDGFRFDKLPSWRLEAV
jgi:hypothetical protein